MRSSAGIPSLGFDRFTCHEEGEPYSPSAAGRPRLDRGPRGDGGPRGERRFPPQLPAATSPTTAIGTYPVETSLRQADGLALSLRSALERIAIPLARAAAAFARRESWCAFGFARLEDHARERFGRSGRWVKDCAALCHALEAFPTLAQALTGDDGGRPIGRVAALLVGRVASAESLAAWVALARTVPVRELRDDVRAARAAASEWPCGDEIGAAGRAATASSAAAAGSPGAPACDTTLDDADAVSDRSLVCLAVPGPLMAAFDEAVDLHRCVEGSDATVTSFIEALIGEARAAGEPPDADCSPMHAAANPALAEPVLARSTHRWSHLPPSSPASWSLALAGHGLARLRDLERTAGAGGPEDLDGQIRALIALEDDLEARLGRVLADLAERGAWARLRFAGVGHYAEERLGLSRTAAEDRVRAARSLRTFPLLRAAYESGRIGIEAALLIGRILGRGPVEPAVERAWLARAGEATVKRLRDEARALGRRGSGRAPMGSIPMEDSDWNDSLRRDPGIARERIGRFGMESVARPGPDVFLRLRLPHDLAGDLMGCIEATRVRLAATVDAVPWDEPWPDAEAAPSTLAARMFSAAARRVPAWVGLLALLEDFALTWDPLTTRDERPAPRRPGDAVYARAGWRCTAPGCTSRRNLEDHHIVYRSRRGCDEMSNRTCLCRFHHQRGEHGDLASYRGEAPLGIVWRLGGKELGVWYKNERRMTTTGESRPGSWSPGG